MALLLLFVGMKSVDLHENTAAAPARTCSRRDCPLSGPAAALAERRGAPTCARACSRRAEPREGQVWRQWISIREVVTLRLVWAVGVLHVHDAGASLDNEAIAKRPATA